MSTLIRLTQNEDLPHLIAWLKEPGVLRWFPMINEREIEDASRAWVDYSKIQAGLTIEKEGIPCGMANLYIHSLHKLKHQCLFSILVGQGFRNQGLGSLLLEALESHAKEKFNIELLHLEVYEHNPAIKLYERKGFIEYGRHPNFLKEGFHYQAKILMQKFLVS